ncbi:aorsin [Aureobasidium pullulans]|uniref:Aorsin n=2 Tax=Aureobasidium pullulans TaxID=5580 RepID=A0A4S9XDX6_AURPU|nr:aorsin [Aureobasidium pullulans]THW73702.1 aorsin [Aureobasidium pullulans]THX07752.1 aorsin [Aureobasidium pullulans]THX98096.1 aorsin [Aureobasidium pullulans]THY16131.1 aorsin [Aureobasidium pullulans]
MRVSSSALLATLLAVAAAKPVPETHVVHEKRDVAHRFTTSRWVKRDRLEKDTVLPVRVGLKQQNLHNGAEWLMDVSHPQSPNFGRHWTQDEVIAKFSPSNETLTTVRDWLVKNGISERRITHSDNKAWFAFDATTKEVEDLLHTQYHEFEHSSTGNYVAACDQYHVPKHIQEHIDFISPGVKGANLRKRGSKKAKRGLRGSPARKQAPFMPKNVSSLATCDQVVTPACIQALYKIAPNDPHAKVSPNNSLGIFEEGDFYAQGDLDRFFGNFTPYIPNGTHPIPNLIDGAKAPVSLQLAGGESDLDFQLAYPLIYPQTTTLYQTDDIYYSFGNDPNATGLFNTFFDAIDGSYCTYSAFGETGNDPVLDPKYPNTHASNGYKGALQCGVYKPTNVISISYGEQEQDLPAYYQQRQCNEWLKLGLQGVSIFVASGDTGVGGIRGDGSVNGCLGSNATVFSPTHPNSCPWLTNVGGTKIYPGRSVYEPESAVNDPESGYSSGGGFSNLFDIPDYQASAVSTYFSAHDPGYKYYRNGQYNSTGGGLYNRNGRGIPDVAANGDNFAVFNAGRFILEGGTSGSAPIFASLINRIVEERIKVGKGALGFVNPTLYEHPEVLNDIVNGTNPGCGTKGFSAVKGWDPVTGLGTPDYPKMLDLFMGLP